MSQKVAIIEDEKDIIRLISYNLEQEGYDVVAHESGEQAYEFVKKVQPDIILLDIMLPVINGFDVCKQLKSDPQTTNTPIIMLTAKGEDSNIVTGLELGADDYMTKPFSMTVLIARIRAALRRAKFQVTSESEKILEFPPLFIYPERHEVAINKDLLNLNHTEFQLLFCLASQPNRVFSRLQIIDFMKGENYYVTPRLIDVLLVSLRKKLGECASFIQTVRGVGYKFKVQ